jgi:hypothetical protein
MDGSTFVSNYSIALLLYLGVPILVIPQIYYAIEDKFLDKELRKIYNLNFSFNYKETENFFVDIGLLILGYMVSGFFVAYIINELTEFISPTNMEITHQSFKAVACASLAFCFSARYTCRKKGYEKGKRILLLLASAASIGFMIKLFIGIDNQFFRSISEQMSPEKIVFIYLNYISSSFISHTRETALYLHNIFFMILIGSCMTALIGEYILDKKNNNTTFICNNQSLYGFVPRFSDFEFIPYNKLKSKMREITSNYNEIKSVKIVSRTLDIFETIFPNLFIEWQYPNSLPLVRTPNLNVKIIAPDLNSIPSVRTVFSVLFNQKGLSQFEQTKGVKYGENYNKLIGLYNSKQIKWVDKDLKEFRILIVNTNNTDKCLLIIDSRTPSGRKIGLYTENPDLIKHYTKIFNSKCR